jgi:predicted nucleotidyltransferase
MIQPCQVTQEKVKPAIERIVAVSQPRKIILFGSYVHGTLRADSDLDVLVVTRSETVPGYTVPPIVREGCAAGEGQYNQAPFS